MRILLVDDDVDFVTSLTGILELEGYPYAVAHSADETLATASRFDPDVALIDIRLGKENGIDLIDRLQDAHPDITCVAISAYADADTAIEAFKAGAYDYLRKPFAAGDLYAMLRRCADRRRLLEQKRQADAALVESEERFRVAFQMAPDAIILARSDGRIIDVNPGFEQMSGYRKEALIDRNSQEVGLWKNPANRTLLLDMLYQIGQVTNFEAEFRRSDGQIRVGLVSARVVQIGGEDVGLFVVRDIQDIKAKETAIMESEERFRSLVGNIPGAVFRCRPDDTLTMQYISAPIHDISGYPATDFVQNRVRSFASIVDPEDLETLVPTLQKAVASRTSFSLEYRIRHADGEVRWIYQRGRASVAADDPVEWIDGVIFDVTERKRIMDELSDSEKRMRKLIQEHRAVLEGIPDAILLIDPELNVVWANHGAVRHFPVAVDALAGMPLARLWGRSDEKLMEGASWVFDSGTPVELFIKSDDGRSWGVKIFPVRDSQNAVLNVILIASDLTEKVRLREQASRSAHLAALGELAAGVAHEINNPTGMILLDMPMLREAFIDLIPLLERHETELGAMKIAGLPFARMCREIPDVIDEVEEGALRIKRIVDELKEFSKPATGETGTIDLNEVVRKAVNLTRNPLKKATDHFVETYASSPLYCEGNAHRLEQVLVNLILNACQALPGRDRGIAVETALSEHGDSVRVTVRDEGVGISPEVLNQITDPFFTTRREVGGTGLGLSVSSRIIDEHKGTLSFDSQPGRGTVATVELPIRKEGTPCRTATIN